MASVGVAVLDGPVEGGSVRPGLPAGNYSDHVLAVRGWLPPTKPACEKSEDESEDPDRTHRIENKERGEHGPFLPVIEVSSIIRQFGGSSVQVDLVCPGFVTICCLNAFCEEFPICGIAVKFFLSCAFGFLIHRNVNNSSLLI